MGTYYDVKEVKKQGNLVCSPSAGKQPHIPTGYKLVAIMDRLLYKAAADVTDPDEFKHFYDQYCEGQFLTMDLYLIRVT